MDLQRVMQQLEIGEEDMPTFLSVVSKEAYKAYERTGSQSDLDLAVIMARRAVSMTQENDPDWAGMVNNLGIMLESRYE